MIRQQHFLNSTHENAVQTLNTNDRTQVLTWTVMCILIYILRCMTSGLLFVKGWSNKAALMSCSERS